MSMGMGMSANMGTGAQLARGMGMGMTLDATYLQALMAHALPAMEEGDDDQDILRTGSGSGSQGTTSQGGSSRGTSPDGNGSCSELPAPPLTKKQHGSAATALAKARGLISGNTSQCNSSDSDESHQAGSGSGSHSPLELVVPFVHP